MAQKITVQDGNIAYNASDPTQAVKFDIGGQLNVSQEVNVGGDTMVPGVITAFPGQDLAISAGPTNLSNPTPGNLLLNPQGSVRIEPTGPLLLNNTTWPTGANQINQGMFVGASGLNTLQFYPFVIGFNSSDTLTQLQLNTTYPNAQPGQSVVGPTVVYQCVSIGTWRTLGNGGGFSGVLPISSGGTGQTTANTALNALLPSQTGNSGNILSTDGTNTSWITPGGSTATQITVTQTYGGGLSIPSTGYTWNFCGLGCSRTSPAKPFAESVNLNAVTWATWDTTANDAPLTITEAGIYIINWQMFIGGIGCPIPATTTGYFQFTDYYTNKVWHAAGFSTLAGLYFTTQIPQTIAIDVIDLPYNIGAIGLTYWNISGSTLGIYFKPALTITKIA